MLRINEKLRHEDIVYIKAFGDYIKVYTQDGYSIHHDTMRRLEKTLPEDMFHRVHRGYIVNIRHIKTASTIGVSLNYTDELIPVIENRAGGLFRKLKQEEK